jgi:5-methylcytosine-specific restriction endonuclease McrA
MKRCSKCKVEKPFEEFNKDKLKKDGFDNQCKYCRKQYRKENKYKLSEQKKHYTKLNPQKVNAKSAKRKAKKLQATPPWLTVEHFKSIERFYVISKEMELISGVKYHVDHVVPLQGDTACGLHVPWNLQVIEASENLSKNNKLLDQEFHHQLPKFDEVMENFIEKC